MLRCVSAAFAIVVACAPAAAQQLQRNFPDTSLRGEMVVVQPPDITLNGRQARLAPGARIRDVDNRLVLSGSIAGSPVTVNYTIDPFGLVKDVWLLRDDEARKFWPRSPDEAARWRLDPITQTWARN
jgi:hypothetical protein